MAHHKPQNSKGGRKPRIATAVLADPVSEQAEAAAFSPAEALEEVACVGASDIAAAAIAAPEAIAAPVIAEQPAVARADETPVQPATTRIDQGATTMTDTINNAMNNSMNQTREATQQAAEQFRTVAGETTERSKAAMEKGARFVEEMADISRGNMEAMVASSKTAAKYVETLSQGAADYNRRSFEQASATLRSFAEVKSPTDLFRLQSEFARSAFDQMVAESARVSETMVKMSGEVAEPLTSRYSANAERMKSLVNA